MYIEKEKRGTVQAKRENVKQKKSDTTKSSTANSVSSMHQEIQRNRPVQLKKSGVVQRAKGVAGEVKKIANKKGILSVSDGKKGIFVTKGGGFMHLHAWPDGCGIHHGEQYGLRGELIQNNEVNKSNLTNTITSLEQAQPNEHVSNMLTMARAIKEEWGL
ncbi:hypothetical protein [[Clostridium] polysaccharolyticum]|uniref:Uncharacterized protein n=1 Tax=[Clostridium] polysaccharolyticum TaxID=29364 RepID=A0A1I0FN07_9FIRM|nr:hypothetical protein [[Clostridium] polysaccharolyticum]SET59520.1 hypothetical protein SAMN04487772_1342 [[Clostridium] polysaccharolyticum]